MSSNIIDPVLAAAKQRAREDYLPYAGALTPVEAYTLLQHDTKVLLVDVRTRAECDWIGRAILPEAQHAAIEWTQYPGGARNPNFLAQLAMLATTQRTLLFLCRSGVRSRFAATLAAANGYQHCMDILEGFEGDKDGAGHRKTVNGWCVAGLPWVGA